MQSSQGKLLELLEKDFYMVVRSFCPSERYQNTKRTRKPS